ncbi:Patatin-like phospholipase domain-containing protein 2 [Oryzias melastigma]|uniref:triacylglycerol lipase n=1 Tax=Oryzias melastigma TaxID=30732 RepID=A0A834F5D0_ORYME|nr:Patatin-like phospholipase domain-containing protein 2 [Oryzias melastigma]
MFDLEKEWSISFAGCGFMGIYYVGVSSCILERFPGFIQNATRIYGASAGSLMAAILTLGVPVDKCCADLMHMAREARKHKLGPLHPAYNLLQLVQDCLLGSLPEDAHIRASGRLCVSLTRVSDGRNLLVSQFSSREDLIQALICSCFVPLYCGVIPPTYKGVHYVDGAVSDNLPRCDQGNTITISPYAGESDLCPRATTLTFHEVRFNNVSIQVNSENLYRVTSTFFPPDPEAMAEICQNGYMDALRFLQENNLISGESPLRSLGNEDCKHACCDLLESGKSREKSKQPHQDHHWLDPKSIVNLPVNIQKVLCKACKETHAVGGLFTQMTDYLPKKVTSYLPFECLAQRVKGWIPDVPRDINWLFGSAEVKQDLKVKAEDRLRLLWHLTDDEGHS